LGDPRFAFIGEIVPSFSHLDQHLALLIARRPRSKLPAINSILVVLGGFFYAGPLSDFTDPRFYVLTLRANEGQQFESWLLRLNAKKAS
jgi:hypothetical protein